MLAATVSGSFHRHMGAITAVVHQLAALSVRVLSPADPRIVAQQGEFLFVASDPVRSVRLVQDRHLEAIRGADFLWLVCPDGYVGQSASMELGFAAAFSVPVFASHAPHDLTLRQYVKIVPTLAMAVSIASAHPQRRRPEGILIDPHATAEKIHRTLDLVVAALTQQNKFDEPTETVDRGMSDLQAMLRFPVYLQ